MKGNDLNSLKRLSKIDTKGMKLPPTAWLLLCILVDSEENGNTIGLTEEQIVWNLENMPDEQAKQYLIAGLEYDKIEPNPTLWPAFIEDPEA